MPWDESLDEIATRMAALRETQGSTAILYYQGFGTRTALQLLNERFFNAFGGVTTLRGTLCGGTGEAAQNLDFGTRQSHDPLDHSNARSLLLWGRNPAVTQQPLLPIIAEVGRRGGKTILVDPIATATAKVVDQHVQPAPGRDLWLALAIAARIFQRGWEDSSYLKAHAEGTESFRRLVNRQPLSDLLRNADVSIAEVDDLAERLTQERPAAILLGWGVHRWRDAHDAIRAIDALGAISGNLGVSGGGVSQGFDEWLPFDLGTRGRNLAAVGRTMLMPRIGREILEASSPPIEMIFVTGGNPLNMAPNSGMVAKAFRRTPTVVYCGQFLDDTADSADYFLPVTTFLEEQDVVASYGHDVVGPVNRAMAPLGECRSHYAIFSGLAQRLGIAEFSLDEHDWLERILAPMAAKGIGLQETLEGPVRLGQPTVPFADGHFATPSGRFRLLPNAPLATPKPPSAKWPYALLSTSPQHSLGSEWLKEDHAELPRVTLSQREGSRMGLSHGEQVRVVSQVGSLSATLLLDSKQRDDVAILPRGGWTKLGHGVNILTEDQMSALGEGAAFYETRVRVEAI